MHISTTIIQLIIACILCACAYLMYSIETILVCRQIPTQSWDMDVIVDFNDHGTGQLKCRTPKAFEKGTYKNRKNGVPLKFKLSFSSPHDILLLYGRFLLSRRRLQRDTLKRKKKKLFLYLLQFLFYTNSKVTLVQGNHSRRIFLSERTISNGYQSLTEKF